MMSTTDLENTQIEIHGTLLWSNDTDYWLSHPQPTGFQNGSAAWFLGGKNVTVDGFGYGTLDGNGQVWYNLVKGQSNYPDRPHALAIWKATDMAVRNLRMVQSQMWTMTIMWSKNVLFDGIYINSTSSNGYPARNTDGADTINSDHITFRNMYIRNGDDAIALKGNSTNILVEDSTFDRSLGIAFGSLGQYKGVFEKVENVTVRRIKGLKTRYGAYVKTWTGDQVSYPPNGGGGGIGYLRNATLSNFNLTQTQQVPFVIGQCTSYSGEKGDCESSMFKISEMTVRGWVGDGASSYVADMDCSEAAGGCDNITIEDVALTNTTTGDDVTKYRCRGVNSVQGFTCN
ncbi:Alpha-L-rhamnosidase rgxB [Colletotrichum sp. SAR 10_70]|nr:Alpha-L-rhamnosidase rgxB [Colletotrichum sp. SAR 10_71]KAI8171287.1 Alpha-L-rhamnosidase rgxB [Colletotrichum sp. SAR 10_70]